MRAPLPLIAEPPFWRPIEADALAALCGVPECPSGALDGEAGWSLGVLSLAGMDGARVPGWGWIREPFAVVLADLGGVVLANLTHLPTGFRIAIVPFEADAIAVADLIAPLGDWASLDIATVNRLPVPATLEAAGFVAHAVLCGQGTAPVWIRERLQ